MTVPDELVEKVARAICAADDQSPDATWCLDGTGAHIPFWKKYELHADAALSIAIADTIERCAKVAYEYRPGDPLAQAIAATIRAMGG